MMYCVDWLSDYARIQTSYSVISIFVCSAIMACLIEVILLSMMTRYNSFCINICTVLGLSISSTPAVYWNSVFDLLD